MVHMKPNSSIWLLILSLFGVIACVKMKPIVGGQVVTRTEEGRPKYPFIVSLQDRYYNRETLENTSVIVKPESTHFCGGSLINAQWILTAAHCIWKKDIKNIIAIIGYENIADVKLQEHYEIQTVEFLQFQPTSFRNDIALLCLRRPYQPPYVVYGLNIYAKLPKRGMKGNRQKPCAIIGYGAQDHAGIIQKNLKKAEVSVITNSQCRNLLGLIWAPRHGENTVCALGDKQDSCQGDSGGPLICDYEGQDHVFGIVSYGLTCGIMGVPSVYTVTIPYVDWIEKLANN